jgi:gamma-glutamyltranspeptidase/glutathione hydrolase
MTGQPELSAIHPIARPGSNDGGLVLKLGVYAIALLFTLHLFGRAAHADPRPHYAVASANRDATDAGMRVLEIGGSAADAAVAMQMVLGVVEPQSSGLGGGAIALYQAAHERRMTAFDGLAKSPSSYDPSSGAASGFSHSGAAVGVPGGVRMLEMMHRRYGRLPWGALFQRAIELADTGFAVSPYLASSLAAASRRGMEVPAWLKDGSGKIVTEGATVRNPELASTLRTVATNGADALNVSMASHIVEVTQRPSLAGRMTVDDIAHYKAVEREPLCLPLRQHVVCSFPPPSYGGVVVLETLGILESRRPPLYSFLDLNFVHQFIEAGRLAEADRIESIGDPDAGSVPVRQLLDPAHLRARAALIQNRSTLGDGAVGVISRGGSRPDCGRLEHPPEPSTSQLAVVDAWGNALAMTTTINVNFGSWLTVSGFFLNDAMTNFPPPSNGACTANAAAGGKRAETSMAPVIATGTDGSVVLTGGSAGAGEIVDYVAQAIIELLAGRAPAEALDDGHVSTARAPYQGSEGLVELEQGRAVSQLARPLAALGHRIRIAPLQSGTAFVVRRHGHWEGASDPRRDGTFASSP